MSKNKKDSNEKILYPINEAPSIKEIKKMQEKFSNDEIRQLEKEVHEEMYGVDKNHRNRK